MGESWFGEVVVVGFAESEGEEAEESSSWSQESARGGVEGRLVGLEVEVEVEILREERGVVRFSAIVRRVAGLLEWVEMRSSGERRRVDPEVFRFCHTGNAQIEDVIPNP